MTDDLNSTEIARNLVRMDSTNPPGNEKPCADYLAEILRGAGMEVTLHEFEPGRTGLIAIARAGGDPLCFTGHLDTVPLGDAEWSVPPFGGEIHDGKLYGRGACDMKGGVAAMVSAAVRLVRGPGPKRDIALILTAGEETGCLGSQAMAADGILPARARALVVGEPTNNRPVLGHKGALWIHGISRGKSAHGSMPEHGVNAISRAAKAIAMIESYFSAASEHPLMGGTTVNVGMISGGTRINMVPDKCEFEADVRTVPGSGHDAILADLAEAVGDLAVLRSSTNSEAVFTDPGHPWIAGALETLTRVSGNKIDPEYVSYFTDASALSKAMGEPPTLLLGPGDAGMAHQTNEWCSVNNIERVSEMYYEIMKNEH